MSSLNKHQISIVFIGQHITQDFPVCCVVFCAVHTIQTMGENKLQKYSVVGYMCVSRVEVRLRYFQRNHTAHLQIASTSFQIPTNIQRKLPPVSRHQKNPPRRKRFFICITASNLRGASARALYRSFISDNIFFSRG